MITYQRRRRDKGTFSVQWKGVKMLKSPSTPLLDSAFSPRHPIPYLHPVVWATTTLSVVRHVGTPWLFSFGPRPRIPWKIISCVNGRFVLSAKSPSSRHPFSSRAVFLTFHFPFFSPLTFAPCLCPLSERSTISSTQRRNCFSLILPVASKR